MRVLESGELRLEPQLAGHADDMFVVLGDPAIYEYENEPPPSLAGLRERFADLESRLSPNGAEQWLNWVVRLAGTGLIGYVQATIYPDARAAVAYEFASRHWGRGLARRAMQAMLAELAARHGVQRLTAVLKRDNQRSQRLLERLGFTLAPVAAHERHQVERDELLMQRTCGTPEWTAAPGDAE